MNKNLLTIWGISFLVLIWIAYFSLSWKVSVTKEQESKTEIQVTNTGTPINAWESVKPVTKEEIEKKISEVTEMEQKEIEKQKEIERTSPSVKSVVLDDDSIDLDEFFKNEKLKKFIKDNRIAFESMIVLKEGKESKIFMIWKNEFPKFTKYPAETYTLINSILDWTNLLEVRIQDKAVLTLGEDKETIVKAQRIEMDNNTLVQSLKEISVEELPSKNIWDILLP